MAKVKIKKSGASVAKSYVYIVMSDDCNEGECDCVLESVDSVWADEKLANERAGKVFMGRVITKELYVTRNCLITDVV